MSDHDTEALVSDQVRVAGLQVDCLDRPLGLESEAPRLSWRLESGRAGAGQTAYRVRVASDQRTLAAVGADIWDSGRIEGDRSLDVAYAGPPLASRQRCWWTVEVWDETGAATSPADPGWWEMGLLAPSDWSAAWLNVETDEDRADREAGLRWIWGAGDAPRRGFRRRFSLGRGRLGPRWSSAGAGPGHSIWCSTSRTSRCHRLARTPSAAAAPSALISVR